MNYADFRFLTFDRNPSGTMLVTLNRADRDERDQRAHALGVTIGLGRGPRSARDRRDRRATALFRRKSICHGSATPSAMPARWPI